MINNLNRHTTSFKNNNIIKKIFRIQNNLFITKEMIKIK
jgi:hypothetical protein